MIVKVVCATGDLSNTERGHENTSREALYDTVAASEEAVIVRFEEDFFSIVPFQRFLGRYRRSGLHQVIHRQGLQPEEMGIEERRLHWLIASFTCVSYHYSFYG